MRDAGAALRLRLAVALEAARAAAPAILSRFRDPSLNVETKGDGSPVTVADREAETILRRRIAADFPDDGVLGEELGESAGDSEFRWILDPIDGTRSFVRGVPLFATLIGIERRGEPAAGVIHLPALEETVYGSKGDRAWWVVGEEAPRPARVSRCRAIGDALAVITSVEGFGRRGRAAAFASLAAGVGLTRTWGDAYGYALVATGRAEIMVDPAMAIWDAAPLLPILEAAGGTFTDWEGRRTAEGGNGVATNGLLRDEALRLLAGGLAPPSAPGAGTQGASW